MTDYIPEQRQNQNKRAFFGSTTNVFDATDDDEEQYFAFSKAAADSGYSIVGMTNTPSAILPNHQQGTVNNNNSEKEGSTMEPTSSVNSNCSMSMDDVKIHTSNNNNSNNNNNNNNNKGNVTNIDVPNVGCKAEPSSKETAENSNGSKIGKSSSLPSKPVSSNSTSSTSSPSSSSSSSPQTTSPQQSPSSHQQQPQLATPPTNNKKRTRATPEQLAILEDTFKTNTSPNSKVREALAEKVNMSERSIQIWFQNRRAKMKAMQKRAHLMINQETIGHHFMACMPGYGHNLYPFRMPIHHAQRIALPRSYSANDLTPAINNVALGMRPQPNSGLGITVPQGFWPSGPLTAPITPITPLSANDPGHLMNGFPFSANSIQQQQQQQQQQNQRFPISPNASPNSNTTQGLRLVVNHPTNGIPVKMNDQQNSISQPQQFTPPQEFVTPTFNNQAVSVISSETLTIGTWRRILTMQAPTDLLCYYAMPQNVFTYHITNDNTQFKMDFSLTDIASIEYRPIDDIYAQIAIEVKNSPNFYMESPQGGWNMCKDFTEDRQATRHMRHVMKGRSIVMKPQIIKLMQDDPLLAKVVTIIDTPIENNQKQENKTDSNGSQINDQEQQNPHRRSSYPPSGSIRFKDENSSSSLSDREDYKSSTSLLKQIARTRRSASVPVSPTDDKNLINPTMASSSSLQVNTSSTFLDLYKADVNSSPEFCSSPMELNSNSSPTTPLYVFDNSPTLMDSSPLLNQDPFISLPSHNLTNLIPNNEQLNEQINEQINAMVFPSSMSGNLSNDDFATIFNNMSSGSDTSSDVSEFLTFNDYTNEAIGENNDGFSSTNSMMNLDISWVGSDVTY